MVNRNSIFHTFFILICGVCLLYLIAQIETPPRTKTNLSLHEKLTKRYGAELMDLYCKKKGISCCDFEIKNEMERLFPKKVMDHFKRQSKALITKLHGKRTRTSFVEIMKKIERIEGIKEKGALYYSLCKILTFALDIPSFRNPMILRKQLTHLHQAIAAIYLTSKKPLDSFTRIGNLAGTKSFLLDNLGVYKGKERLAEMATWELSLLLNCDSYIAPTSAQYSHDTPVIYQTFGKAKFLRGLFFASKVWEKRARRISEWNFWKPNLFLFLIGHMDLTMCNIGVRNKRTLFICDNENAFSNKKSCRFKVTKPQEFTLELPYMNMMLDWPQAKNPLSKRGTKQIKKLLEKWGKIKPQLTLYFNHPFNEFHLSPKELQSLEYRLGKVLKMHWIEGETTFQDFILTTYPHLYDGVEELAPLSSPIIGSKASPMSALLFISMCRGWWHRYDKNYNEKFIKCLEKYHEQSND